MQVRKNAKTKVKRFWGFLFDNDDRIIFEEGSYRDFEVDLFKSTKIHFKNFLYRPIEVLGRMSEGKLVIISLSLTGEGIEDMVIDIDIDIDNYEFEIVEHLNSELREHWWSQQIVS